MTERSTEDNSASVNRQRRSKQAEERRTRWAWAEPSVWTDRMLTALEKGVKGGIWFSLIDKVYRLSTLQQAFTQVKANDGSAGVDRQTIAMFESQLESNLEKLSEQLRSGTYHPREVRRVLIPKPGSKTRRPLGIPTVRDRVVQTALRSVIEPIFERDFAEHSYGFRPKRGCKDALRRVDTLLKAGYTHVVDVDLKSYFDTIPHGALMSEVRRKVADSRVLALIESFLKQSVMEGLDAWTPTSGSPQGAVISPLLSNVYLDPLDRLMAESGVEMVRYADDFVILCRTAADASAAFAQVQRWTSEADLTLHLEKTRQVDAETEGFDFLGYHFRTGSRWPSKKSEKRLRAVVRQKTPRVSGRSLEATIANINRTLPGWLAYFKHSSPTSTFEKLDGFVRRRLRRMLQKRRKRHKSNGCGLAHQIFPTAYFTAHGLFSLAANYRVHRQSALR